MSWTIVEKYRKMLSRESGTQCKEWGGKLTVCLVYPNHYRTGMSNLGMQAVYALLNERADVVCERAFLPDAAEAGEYRKSRSKLMSLESQRPLLDFDLIAFSVSFENDYLNIPVIFELAGIPCYSRDRDSSMPLVMGGGAALFLNPEPVADFMDMVAIGEAEPILAPLIDLLTNDRGDNRNELMCKAANLPGIYVPSFYAVDPLPGATPHPLTGNVPARIKRVFAIDLDRQPTGSILLTPETEFGDMYLIELSRGCPHGCRFCAAGFIYLPYRQRSLTELEEQVRVGLREKKRIGLVGAAVADHRDIGELCRTILDGGGKVSVSSLRLDSLDSGLIEMLEKSGHKSIAIAPEGGSQRLRDLIRKNISEEQILAACDLLISHDILNIRLYFIIGLPTETDNDLEELIALVNSIRERVVTAAKKNRRLGEVVLSVNPFVPKPFTPFQWCGMDMLAHIEKKAEKLRKAVGGMANVRLQMESPRAAMLQAFLSRGDRTLAPFLVYSMRMGSWKRAAKAMGIDLEQLTSRWLPLDERLPWNIIDNGRDDILLREYKKAFP
jgi:radical SAM superfamily enzyme YgiQ (UPF0313 family)